MTVEKSIDHATPPLEASMMFLLLTNYTALIAETPFPAAVQSLWRRSRVAERLSPPRVWCCRSTSPLINVTHTKGERFTLANSDAIDQ